MTLVFHGLLFAPKADSVGSPARYAYPKGDFYDQFHAFAVYEHDRLWSGELPLWNPYTFGGHPFWADVQAAVLYPPSLLTMALSGPGEFSPLWLELEAAGHFFLGALLTYLFSRRLLQQGVGGLAGWRCAVGATISALTFSFGGYLAGYPSQQLAILETQIWLPLLLLLLDVGLAAHGARGERRALVGAGLAWGLALLAGHPQSAMYVLYVALLYGLVRAWQLGLGWIPAGLAQVIWVGIGLCVSAVHWLPALEFMRLSVRSSLTYEALAGGLAWRDLAQFLTPDVYTYWSPMYVGILPLALALAGSRGWLVRGSRTRRVAVAFWLCLVLVSLVLSLGGKTFLYRLFYWTVPGFRLFRSQERAIFVTSFALAILSGYGWQWFSAQEMEDRSVRCLSQVLLALSVVSLAALVLLWRLGDTQAGFERGVWLKPLVLAAGLIWASWALVRWVPRRSLWAAILALCLVCVDLSVVNAPRNLSPGSVESRVYDDEWLEPVLRDESLYRTANEWGLPGNAGILLRREDLYGASPLRLQAHKEMADALPRWRLWQLFGVRYVMTWEHDCPAPYACHRIAMLGDEWAKNTVYLHRIEPRFERAWIVHRARVVDAGRALSLLADPEYDPFDEVLLSSELDGSRPRSGPGLSDAPKGLSTVEVRELSPERMRVLADLAAPGWLVVGEWYYPGWQARVDGERQPIYRAHYGLRAVALDAGVHEIEFVYRPVTFYAGSFLSLIALVGAVVLLAIKPRARNA
jgi:hypothetical protein